MGYTIKDIEYALDITLAVAYKRIIRFKKICNKE